MAKEMNTLIREANERGRFTIIEGEVSPGGTWLRGQIDQAQQRGTDPGPSVDDPFATPLASLAHGSADGGAGANAPIPGLSMNDVIRQRVAASHEAHRRDRS